MCSVGVGVYVCVCVCVCVCVFVCVCVWGGGHSTVRILMCISYMAVQVSEHRVHVHSGSEGIEQLCVLPYPGPSLVVLIRFGLIRFGSI